MGDGVQVSRRIVWKKNTNHFSPVAFRMVPVY